MKKYQNLIKNTQNLQQVHHPQVDLAPVLAQGHILHLQIVNPDPGLGPELKNMQTKIKIREETT